MTHNPKSPLQALILDAEALREVLTPLERAQWIEWHLRKGARFLRRWREMSSLRDRAQPAITRLEVGHALD